MQIECIVYKGNNVDYFYNKFKERLEQNIPMSVNFNTDKLLISGELKDILDENTLKVKKLLEGEKSETNIRFYNTNRTTVSIYRK